MNPGAETCRSLILVVHELYCVICILLSAFVGWCVEFVVTVTGIIITHRLTLINDVLCRRIKIIKEPVMFGTNYEDN